MSVHSLDSLYNDTVVTDGLLVTALVTHLSGHETASFTMSILGEGVNGTGFSRECEGMQLTP